MILCTENDKDFIEYKYKIKNRKTIFTIKQIFKDCRTNFLKLILTLILEMSFLIMLNEY